MMVWESPCFCSSPRDPHVKFHDAYDLAHALGCGTFSTVFECRQKGGEIEGSRSTSFAVKVVEAQGASGFHDEVEVLRTVADARGCVRIHDVFDERSKDLSEGLVYIVTELVSGGSLLSLLAGRSQQRTTEAEAQVVARHLFTACETMHSRGVIHRDIKPENILLRNKTDLSAGICVADFGLATRVSPGELAHQPCGSPLYVAPEVVTARNAPSKRRSKEYLQLRSKPECVGYGPAADIWSCGVVLFCMLSGAPPFYDTTVEGLLHRTKTATLSFDGPAWKEVSSAGKDFIRQCLVKRPDKRITAAKALSQHRWLA